MAESEKALHKMVHNLEEEGRKHAHEVDMKPLCVSTSFNTPTNMGKEITHAETEKPPTNQLWKAKESTKPAHQIDYADLIKSVEAENGRPARVPGIGESVNVHGRVLVLNQLLGKGGSGQVFCARDVRTNQNFALKLVNTSAMPPVAIQALNRELAIMKALRDASLVARLIDCEYKADRNCLIMLMEKGQRDLRSHLKQYNFTLAPRMIVRYWLGMLRAVEEVHVRGIVHADLKLSNFVILHGTIKLIDFGVANVIPQDRDVVTQLCLMGTVDYMSPEAVQVTACTNGESKIRVNTKSDVWSLGVILYEMAFRRKIFGKHKNTEDKLAAICDPNYEIPLPDDCCELLKSVLRKCLDRNPECRPSVRELIVHPYITRYFANER